MRQRYCIDCGAILKAKSSMRCRSCASRKLWRDGILHSRDNKEIMRVVRANVRQSKSGCYEWQGQVNSMGYPRMSVQGRLMLLHRYIFQRTTGIDPIGKCVCHHCDNPRCLNPKHLFLGTQSDNMRDMVKKGRHGYRKLNDAQVLYIKELPHNEWRRIADEYGISGSYVRCIQCGHARRSVLCG